MPHQYRTSRGAIIEWRTSEAVQTTGTLAPRPQQKFVLRGQGRVARSRVPEAAGADITVSVPAGSLTLTGYAPTVQVSSNQAIQVPAGTLTLTGNAPTVATTANQLIAVPAGALTLTGYAPTVIGTSVTPDKRDSGAGRSKRVRKRYQVEIDGEAFDVESPEEAKQVLETLRQAAEQKAAEVVSQAAQTKRLNPRKIIRDARKELVLPEIAAPQQFAGLADGVLEQVRRTYEDALRTIEIAALLRQREIEEDDEEVMLLL